MAAQTPTKTPTKHDHYTASQLHLDNPHKSLHTHLNSNHSAHMVEDLHPGNVSDIPYTHAKEAHFEPGVAKVNVAATGARPQGTTEDDWAKRHEHQTVLQQHASYWDKDGDGVIWPLDTYRGCRAWGWNPVLCLIAVVIINGGLSYPTGKSWLPDPFFRIFVLRVHRDKHGSDSLSYDNQGRFRPQAFEEFFANYDRGNKGGLTIGDLVNAWRGQRMVFDFFGWSAFFFEWLAMYLLIWPEDGIMRKEEIRKSYDGILFQQKADEYAEKQKRANNGYGRMYDPKHGPPRID